MNDFTKTIPAMPEARRHAWQAALPQAQAVVARMEALARGFRDSHGGMIGDWERAERDVVKDVDRLHRVFSLTATARGPRTRGCG